MTTEEKLKHFEESSMERAKEKSAQMVAEHKAAIHQLEQEHKEEKDRQAALQIKSETDRLKRETNMALSKAHLDIKRKITKKNKELKEKLFVEVKTKLEEYMDTPAYEQLLIKQIQEIKKIAGKQNVTIYIDPADASKQLSLHAATNSVITISQYSFMGGTRAVITDRHMLIDNSFASKLEEVKAEFTFKGGISHE